MTSSLIRFPRLRPLLGPGVVHMPASGDEAGLTADESLADIDRRGDEIGLGAWVHVEDHDRGLSATLAGYGHHLALEAWWNESTAANPLSAWPVASFPVMPSPMTRPHREPLQAISQPKVTA